MKKSISGAIKKLSGLSGVLIPILCLFFLACPQEPGGGASAGDDSNGDPPVEVPGDDQDGDPPVVVKTGKVTFYNASSYKVAVHQGAFSGPVLLELSSGESKGADVRTSDNYGVGSTFSIEYLWPITNVFDEDSGEVTAGGIDPNVQINFVVEADKSYTKQIPQPANIEFQNAFVKIINSSNLPFEFRYLGVAFKQAGNGNISVAPYKTGVYKLEGIPAEGKLFQNYQIVSTFASVAVSDFTAENGFIYNFNYDGSSVTKTGEQTITFK